VRKVVNTLIASVLLTLVSLPMAAHATQVDPNIDIDQVDVYGGHDEKDIQDMHSEIEEIYENYSGVLIPPVVINVGQPTDPNIYVLPTLPEDGIVEPGAKPNTETSLERLGTVNGDEQKTLDAYRHSPIPIDSVKLTTATPTDEFMDGARVFGAGLALAALTLFGITSLNTVRSRKRKAQYLSASKQ